MKAYVYDCDKHRAMKVAGKEWLTSRYLLTNMSSCTRYPKALDCTSSSRIILHHKQSRKTEGKRSSIKIVQPYDLR